MSFEGDSFYSYSTVIARHITHKGKAGIIINCTSYSNSTAKHNSHVRSAIPSTVPVFWIGDLGRGVSLDFYGNEGKALFEYAVTQSNTAIAKAEKARTNKGIYEGQAAAWLQRARFINEFFGLRRKVDEKTIERLREASERSEREAAKQRAAAEEKRRIEQTAAFEAWKRGERTTEGYYFSANLFPVAFRIECGELVSSKGARVPLEAARIALRFVLKHRQSGWHRNGSACEVGMYQLDAVNAQGIVAGCHRITWDEVERIAPLLT